MTQITTRRATQPAIVREVDEAGIRAIQGAWNSMADRHGLPLARVISEKRKAALRARVREAGVAAVIEAINRVPQAPFLLGNNDRSWKADLDFLLQSKSFARVLEGFYATLRTRTTQDQLQERAVTYAREGAVSALERLQRRNTE